MKVTDLEKFALEQIYRPYWAMLMQQDYPRLSHLTNEHSLDAVLPHMADNSEWAELVLDRIYRCEFKFPRYIVHPLVSHIEEYNRKRRKAKELVEPLEETV